jgi:endonuclease/exonuclease/phosphatase family metal-dependent hydrolase
MLRVLLVVAVVAACSDDPGGSPDASVVDAAPDATIEMLKVMTFNIRSGRESSLAAIADAINAEAPDLVAMQEVDVNTMRTGMVDQPHRLGQLTGMTNLFRTAIPLEGGSYGLAVLSEHPIISSTSTPLTSVGEQRILMTVEIEIEPGRVITVANTHFGLDAAARVTQSDEVIAAVGTDDDVLLFGDLNDEPGTPPIARLDGTFRDAWALGGVGEGFTIPVTTPTRRIDFIYLGRAWGDPIDVRVIDTQTSDHRPVVAQLPLR